MARSIRGPVLAAVAAGVISIALLGGWMARARLGWVEESRHSPESEATAATEAFSSEAERLAYVEENIRIVGLEVKPKSKPDREERLPGLLSVEGTVENHGRRRIDRVTLVVLPLDGAGEVIGSFVENLARESLAAGERRAFAFTIPESGEFSHRVKYEVR